MVIGKIFQFEVVYTNKDNIVNFQVYFINAVS